jgi:hypothetical protein
MSRHHTRTIAIHSHKSDPRNEAGKPARLPACRAADPIPEEPGSQNLHAGRGNARVNTRILHSANPPHRHLLGAKLRESQFLFILLAKSAIGLR